VKRHLVGVGLCVLLLISAFSVLGSAYTSTPRFNLGETIQFGVEDSATWWWGCCCCCCDASTVYGWRVLNSSGITVYSVIHDEPVASTAWQGSWPQVDADGIAVSAGYYTLYVDTSVGTLSRCFYLYDPCDCCSYYSTWCCSSCACESVSSISSCGCSTALQFVDTCTSGCTWFWWFGCGCSSCP